MQLRVILKQAGIWNEIQSVPKACEAKKPVDYLTVKAIEAIIAQPDVTTRKGKRDAFLLLFLYQTGARVQELVDVRICDLALDSRNIVTLHGKRLENKGCPYAGETCWASEKISPDISP